MLQHTRAHLIADAQKKPPVPLLSLAGAGLFARRLVLFASSIPATTSTVLFLNSESVN